MKSQTIITVVIILLLAGAWYWTEAQAQAQKQQQELLEEFNAKIAEYNTLVKEQDKLTNSRNTETDLDLRLQKERNYLDWLDQHENTMEDFMTYVETNHEGLRKLGLNPDYTRDNIKTVLLTMRENRATVQVAITDTKALQQLLEEFNVKVVESNELLKEQDQLISSFNTETDLDLRIQKARNYLYWVKQHENTMADFMTYVEINEEGLRKAGLNPDYQRDNIKTTLMTIKENEATMQAEITGTEILQQVIAESGTGQGWQ